FVGQSMMKKAVLVCVVLFAVIFVTTTAQCVGKIQAYFMFCRDDIDNKMYKRGDVWVNNACQYCTC
ncbi:hypothetical protein QTP70_015769, partial [Hemibagrus guttatus]